MNSLHVITDKELIKEVLNEVEYGILSMCLDGKPYAVPINFVEDDGVIYLHGGKKGKKVEYIKANSNVCFSVVDAYSLLPSYFSTDDQRACPATQLFKSLTIDGVICFVKDYEEKEKALTLLMRKLQKEGGYNPLNDKQMYKKMIEATEVMKITIKDISAKFKLGQNFNKNRYERVIKHLKQRGTKKDLDSLKLIGSFR